MKKSLLMFAFFFLVIDVTSYAAGDSVTKVEGAPLMMRAGSTMTPAPGAGIQEGDVLMTPTPTCQLDISLGGLAGCRLLPNTEAKMKALTDTRMTVEVEKGNVILNMKKLPEGAEFKVETPTAIAAVRGTQFWGRVTEPGGSPVTTFAVREGSVEIFAKAANKIFKLEKGQALDIPADGVLPAIRPALPEEMKAMEQAASIRTSA